MSNSNYRKDSFLRGASVIDNRFLGVNNLPRILRTAEDEIYEIDHSYDQRPDLLAHKLYGNSRLWWVFSQRNPDVLRDPIRDFSAGTRIVVPPRSAVENALK
jgi:hypothetical protein